MTRIEEIKEAVEKWELTEPFGEKDLDRVFPDWPEGTRKAYLYKHMLELLGIIKNIFKKLPLVNFA